MAELATTFAFRMASDEAARTTDNDLVNMVGTVRPVSFFGMVMTAKITAARRYTDELLGDGVWIEAKYIG